MRRLSAERQRTSGCRRRCHAPPLSGGSQAAPVALAWDQAHRKAVLHRGQAVRHWADSSALASLCFIKTDPAGEVLRVRPLGELPSAVRTV